MPAPQARERSDWTLKFLAAYTAALGTALGAFLIAMFAIGFWS